MNEETRSEEVSKAKETVKRGAKSGAFAAASGGITLVRGLNALRKRQWKRGVVRLLAAGFWFGVAAVQRRMGEGGSGPPFGDDEVDQRSVADTSPDITDVATDADEGTGTESPGDPSEVVDTMSTDLDEHDTATELDSDVDADDVNQSDVVDTSIDPEVAEEAQEPASTDNAQVVEEEGETDIDTGRDEDDENEAEPEPLDDDATPAITESDGSGDDADDDQGEAADEDEE